ncbi:MAG: GNAT family N-acetyltransferase [Proteobacteria bacterium]|nr:GNAT family N-acetyltransferase [Pseudomonadota bacterium]
MELVECTKEYWEFVRLLRMDERVLDGFIEQVEITPEQQEKYMTKYSHCYRIALINNQPAGFVGAITDDIRVCTHPDFQGKGLGKFMLEECMKIWPTSYAKVKINNLASNKLFLAAGFETTGNDNTFIYYKKS